jgi:signal transduction histidine kinase
MTDKVGSILVDARNTGSEFEIRVRDSGSGIPESIRTTLFDPFVSFGKPNGTGLGLAIVSKIVHDHSGSVSIEETSGAGTTVVVRLPLAEETVSDGAKSVLP